MPAGVFLIKKDLAVQNVNIVVSKCAMVGLDEMEMQNEKKYQAGIGI